MTGSEIGWTPIWAMPNVTIDDAIETEFVALVTCHDERVRFCSATPNAQDLFEQIRD
jgi:hypothetical protein